MGQQKIVFNKMYWNFVPIDLYLYAFFKQNLTNAHVQTQDKSFKIIIISMKFFKLI